MALYACQRSSWYGLFRNTCLPNLAEVKHLVAGIESQISTILAYRKSLIH